MDQIGDKGLPSLTQTITSSNFLKRATKLILSLSLCSFLFSSYSSMYSFILHSMNYSHSTFPFAIDKNYVFLVFNGILVFIAKTSGSLLCFDLNDDNPSIKNIYEEGVVQMITTTQSETLESEELGEEYHHHDHDHDHECYLMKEEEEEEEEGEIIRLSDDDQLKEESEEQEGKSGTNLFDDHEEGEEQQQHESIFFIEESQENEIDPRDGPMAKKKKDVKQKEMNIGVLSTEELNKKFDEFIRRMKAEIRIEAQRTLIMV